MFLKKVIVSIGLCSWMSGICFAQVAGRESLKELPPFTVEIEELPSAVTDLGITKLQLQTDVELRLRKASIKILDVKDSGSVLAPFLLVRITGIKATSSPTVACSISIGLNQMTSIPRLESVQPLFMTETWHTGTIIIGGTTTVSQGLRGVVGDLVDEFTNAYLFANTK